MDCAKLSSKRSDRDLISPGLAQEFIDLQKWR